MVSEPPPRAIAQIEAAAEYLRPIFAELAQGREFPHRHPLDQWKELVALVKARDPRAGKRLEAWNASDQNSVIHRITHPDWNPPQKLWSFERKLTCWLVPDTVGCSIVIDANDGRYKQERFSRHAQKLAVEDAKKRAHELKSALAVNGKWKQK